MAQNPNAEILSDVQSEWKKLTGVSDYPMSVLVVRKAFADKNGKLVKSVKEDYSKSIETVLADPHEAALRIEKEGIMKASLAESAIKDCALVFK